VLHNPAGTPLALLVNKAEAALGTPLKVISPSSTYYNTGNVNGETRKGSAAVRARSVGRGAWREFRGSLWGTM
jgi:hypothetical protein